MPRVRPLNATTRMRANDESVAAALRRAQDGMAFVDPGELKTPLG